jgi:hypothetical protein
MLFRETVAVYCENHTEHTNTLCGQSAAICSRWFLASGFFYSEVGGDMFLETSVHTRSTRRHIPEYGILHNSHRCENLKSYEMYIC